MGRTLERFFVPFELRADGSLDPSVVRRRYRRVVLFFIAASVIVFLPTLVIAGVPVPLWPGFVAGVVATAALLACSLLVVETDSPVALVAAGASAVSIFLLDHVIGDYYHQAPALFALVVAGHAIISGFKASLVMVVAGAILVPFSSVPSGGPTPVDAIYAFLYFIGLAGIVWTYKLLHERSASAVQASESRFRELVERVPAVVYTAEPDPLGAWTYVSPKALDVVGVPAEAWTDDPGTWWDRIHPADLDSVRAERLARQSRPVGERSILEYRIIAQDGRERWIRDEATVVLGPATGGSHWNGILVDVTEQRDLEARLRQANRMEAVGQLAGGIAHDFNNLLTAIRGYAELLRGTADEASVRDIEELIDAADRAAALTRQLLAFSRRQALKPVALAPADVIERLVPMLRRLLGEHIELVTRHDPGPACVVADVAQLEQVIVNLAVNARDAMPGGGRLSIETSLVVSPEVAAGSVSPDAGVVRIRVADTGHGMDEATRARIFEPFFTTKDVGQGTGMGLATVFGIIEQSGGVIACASEPSKGTVFTMDLPAVRNLEPDRDACAAALPAGGSERILLVEDEPGVRVLTRRMLERLGYHVVDAENGRAALDLLEQGVGADMVLTDVRMPDMRGPELVRIATAARPGLRALLMSGYPEEAVEGRAGSTMRLLEKPFNLRELADAVRACLDQPPDGERAAR